MSLVCQEAELLIGVDPEERGLLDWHDPPVAEAEITLRRFTATAENEISGSKSSHVACCRCRDRPFGR